MRNNQAVISSSKILECIVSKIERDYPEDVEILICYGSYIDGSHTSVSDIDFCYLPKNGNASSLSSQFIVDGIGYDLWQLSWERIDTIVSLDESFASIIMNGVVLYSRSQEILDLLESKKQKLMKNLGDSDFISRKSSLALARLKTRFFDSLAKKDCDLSVEVVEFFEDMLFVLSLINGIAIKKGAKELAREIENFRMYPIGILKDYQQLICTSDREVIVETMRRLILETESIWNTRFVALTETRDFSSLVGFYEELKSVYNKLVFTCKSAEYSSAYYAAHLIDRETQSTLCKVPSVPDYPGLTATLKNSRFSLTLEACAKHEELLLDVLAEGKVKVNMFKDLQEYMTSWRGEHTNI